MHETLLETLRQLELELQGVQIRKNSTRLKNLLHDEFIEIGRSGKRYTKIDITREFDEYETVASMKSSDFFVRLLSPSVALLTYKSADVDEAGNLYRHASRSSIWLKLNDKWQITYHQGTETG